MLEHPTMTERIKLGVATLGGIGFVSAMPGTMGSLVALILGLGVHFAFGVPMALPVLLVLLGCTIILGLWSVPMMETHWGNDPSCVVIDELVGMWCVLTFVECMQIIPAFFSATPYFWFWICAAFVLFRVFDIAKPFPISRLNAQKGAFFVIADDFVAGIFASGGVFCLWLIWQLFEKWNIL